MIRTWCTSPSPEWRFSRLLKKSAWRLIASPGDSGIPLVARSVDHLSRLASPFSAPPEEVRGTIRDTVNHPTNRHLPNRRRYDFMTQPDSLVNVMFSPDSLVKSQCEAGKGSGVFSNEPFGRPRDLLVSSRPRRWAVRTIQAKKRLPTRFGRPAPLPPGRLPDRIRSHLRPAVSAIDEYTAREAHRSSVLPNRWSGAGTASRSPWHQTFS